LGRGCEVYQAPRTILRSIPGIELVEMERNRRWAWCCGGGGGGPEAYPGLGQWDAGDRLRGAGENGARLVFKSSPPCPRSFAGCSHNSLATQDLLDFVCQAL